MAVSFNEATIAPDSVTPGVERQRLLTPERVAHTKVLLDRVRLHAGARLPVSVGESALAWIQVLEGEVLLTHLGGKVELGSTHIAFLPPQWIGQLTSHAGAVFLHAQVPDARSLDPGFANAPPAFGAVDWTREPVLDSQHDARKRIYVVTPKLFGTKAVKGEMIIYPPGTEAAKHHHEGAEHFMYVLKGSGTAYANDAPIRVRSGDLIYYDDRESHYLRNDGAEDMVFVEFFVPGLYKTVWAEGASVCTWLPTGRDIRGGKPVREIAGHSSAAAVPQDV